MADGGAGSLLSSRRPEAGSVSSSSQLPAPGGQMRTRPADQRRTPPARAPMPPCQAAAGRPAAHGQDFRSQQGDSGRGRCTPISQPGAWPICWPRRDYGARASGQRLSSSAAQQAGLGWARASTSSRELEDPGGCRLARLEDQDIRTRKISSDWADGRPGGRAWQAASCIMHQLGAGSWELGASTPEARSRT